MQKISKDKNGGINLPPLHIKLKETYTHLFGIPDLIYSLDNSEEYYLHQENSGLIRGGFSIDFYKKYKHCFTILTDIIW